MPLQGWSHQVDRILIPYVSRTCAICVPSLIHYLFNTYHTCHGLTSGGSHANAVSDERVCDKYVTSMGQVWDKYHTESCSTCFDLISGLATMDSTTSEVNVRTSTQTFMERGGNSQIRALEVRRAQRHTASPYYMHRDFWLSKLEA